MSELVHRGAEEGVSLGELLRHSDLDMWVEVSAGSESAGLRWVTVSELEDPSGYLLGGELVLSAGIRHPATEAAAHTYVERLKAAGIAALGFGISPVHDSIPDGLVEACRTHGLTLLSIAPNTPFVQIGLVFARMMERKHLSEFRGIIDDTRVLMTAGADGDTAEVVLEAIRERIGAWWMLADARGEIYGTGAPEVGDQDVRARVDALVGRVLKDRRPAVATDQLETSHGRQTLVAFQMGRCSPWAGCVVFGREGTFSASERTKMSVAVGLVDLLDSRLLSGERRVGALAAAILLNQEQDLSPEVIRELTAYLGDHERQVRVVRGRWVRRSRPYELGDERRAWAKTLRTALVAGETGLLQAIVPGAVDGAARSELVGRGWQLAISSPVEVAQIKSAVKQAQVLARRAGATTSVIDGETLRRTTAELVDPEVGAQYATEVLEPLLAFPDQQHRQVLMEALSSWISNHGRWDATARELGHHRNTVRRLIQQASTLLEVPLDDPQVRVDLWLALHWLALHPNH